MGNISFDVNKEKVVETILYIANRLKNPTRHSVFKMMYFADKLHLDEYGRFITGDTYIAMERGPVPSVTYDMTKGPHQFKIYDSIEIIGYHIRPLRQADISILSESDTECLDRAIADYGQLSFGQLSDISHDEAWQQAPDNGEMSVESIVAMLRDSEELIAHLRDQHP